MTEMGGLYSGRFGGYRRQTRPELESALASAVVAIDTNVLIDLYRYRPQTAEDLLSTLERIGDRLIVPHQVVREFWRRHSVNQSSPKSAMNNLQSALEKNQRSMETAIRTWGKDLGVGDTEIENLGEQIDRAITQALKDAEAAVDNGAATVSSGDRFIDRIATLVEGRVTARPDDEEWEQCVIEGKRRVDAEEPPGYMDKEKEESGRAEGAAGDYLVWYQATKHASASESDLVFITRDEKEDWWWKQRADFLGPRPELSFEYSTMSHGKRVFFLRPADLLEIAPTALQINVSEESSRDAERMASRVDADEDDGDVQEWTLAALSALLEALDEEAPTQASALREAAKSGGRIERERIYELGEYNDDRMLRGFTRPFTRLTAQLQYRGLIPDGVRPIFSARYPHGVKVSYFIVPPEVPDLMNEIQTLNPEQER